jgi:hypothetical protein
LINVIETNILYKDGEISDTQSRVIHVESWDSYVEEFRLRISKNRSGKYANGLYGSSLPRNFEYVNFKSDDHKIVTELKLFDGTKVLKICNKGDFVFEMSSKEFSNKMNKCVALQDEEISHIKADELMCDALRRLGYHNGVDIFESMHKWYA